MKEVAVVFLGCAGFALTLTNAAWFIGSVQNGQAISEATMTWLAVQYLASSMYRTAFRLRGPDRD